MLEIAVHPLLEVVQVIDRGARRQKGTAEDTHHEIGIAVAVQVAERGGVVATGGHRIARGEGHGRPPQDRSTALPRGVLDQQQPGLEEVAPEQIVVTIPVDVAQRHRVGAVPHPLEGRHDLDVFEEVGDVAEAGNSPLVAAVGLVARDRPRQTPDQQIEPSVAVDVGRVRDVLAVREDGLARDVPKGVGRQHVARGAGAAVVAVVADVAVRLLGQQVEVAVEVHVNKAEPLADRQLLVVVGDPAVAAVVVPKEHHAVGSLLQEEVEITVAIRVRELRAWEIESAQEGMVHRCTARIAHLNPVGSVDYPVPPAAVERLRRGAPHQKRCHDENGQSRATLPHPPAGPIDMPAGYAPTSIVRTTSKVRVSIFTTVPTSELSATFWSGSYLPERLRLETKR